MIPAGWYLDIYLLIVTLLTIILTTQYKLYPDSRIISVGHSKSLNGFLLSVFFALFIGFRPIHHIFVDTVNYRTFYYAIHYGADFCFDWTADNLLFDNIFAWLASQMFDIRLFFVFIAVVYFVGAYVACSKLFPKDTIYAFIVFLGAFSTYSYGTNGIKAGAAASLFLCALAYRDNKIKSTLLLFASLGFHHSMLLPVVAFFLGGYVKRTKYYLIFWCMCLFISLAHITYFQTLLAGFSDESGARYLNDLGNSWGGKTGFRIDFVLYSALPIAIGYYVIFKRNLKSEKFDFVFNLYVFINAVWLLCMYAAFTNRIAYLSWLLYPVVLIYPFFDRQFVPNQYIKLNQVVWMQLMFTLFMELIYY